MSLQNKIDKIKIAPYRGLSQDVTKFILDKCLWLRILKRNV